MKGKTILQTLAVAVLALAAYTALVVLGEKKIVFHPYKYPEGFWDPGSYGLRVEDVYFPSEDGVQLHGWYVARPDAAATLLWFHGNAGNLSHRLDNLLELRRLKINVFIFDYRGYGRSEGEPDEEGLYRDSRAAYRVLTGTKNIAPGAIFLFGRSLGGACAIEVALRHPAAGLILESAFTSAGDMAKKMFPLLPIARLMRSRFDSLSKISRVRIPALFLHGDRDDLVPYELGRKLYDAANEPKEFYDIRGAGHNDTYVAGGEAYFETLDRFIAKTLGRKAEL
ncbi:MAG: alpha/beta hydrolase [Nitrospinae bacterium]|nr:alpha/beta hydrolase [Nitrospinota bacterium]